MLFDAKIRFGPNLRLLTFYKKKCPPLLQRLLHLLLLPPHFPMRSALHTIPYMRCYSREKLIRNRVWLGNIVGCPLIPLFFLTTYFATIPILFPYLLIPNRLRTKIQAATKDYYFIPMLSFWLAQKGCLKTRHKFHDTDVYWDLEPSNARCQKRRSRLRSYL